MLRIHDAVVVVAVVVVVVVTFGCNSTTYELG